jgi:hypothetical protein
MKKDLIIAFSSNYTWNDIQYWVNSLKKTGYAGEIHIVSDNMNKETIEKLASKNIKISLYGKKNDAGDFVAEQSIAPHVNRFFYIWNVLNTLKEEEYRYVVTTDIRDVIFQSDPMVLLEDFLVMFSLVASSEGLRYKDEPWGNKNLQDAFGPFYHNLLKDKLIYNVGVIGGDFQTVRGLLSLIFQLSINRPIQIVDQAVYNYILNTEPFVYDTFFTNNSYKWAVQLGTTLQAVQAGSGDLGQAFLASQENRDAYFKAYDDLPVWIDNGEVYSVNKAKYAIVHQWDRVPELAEKIKQLYGDNDVSEPRVIFYHPV